MARKEAHGGRAPRASEKNPLPLSFHLGGLFLSPNFFALSPLSLSLSLSLRKTAADGRSTTQRRRCRRRCVSEVSPLLPLSVLSHSFSLCFPHRVMEEIPDVADPAAMSGRGSNEGWPNAGQVNSGFTSPGSSEVSPCSSSSPHACLLGCKENGP